jgi:flagellar biosynthesis protein FlhB
MACFLVPTAEAIVTKCVSKAVKEEEQEGVIPFSRKLKWLSNLLVGGSTLLAFEHVWHGEVVPWFPFLTAASNPEDLAVMLHEMSTIGVTMAVLVTGVWCGMLAVAHVIEHREPQTQPAKEGV